MITNNKYYLFATLALILSFLSGCAGSVKFDESSNYQYRGEKYSQVEVSLSKEATVDYENNKEFNKDAIQQTVYNHLNSINLINKNAQNKLIIEITEINIRSSFAAIMFGFLAGADSIEGKVNLKDARNRDLGSFDVSASYALGGTGGGQDGTRMNWLYTKFAELTTDTILRKTDS